MRLGRKKVSVVSGILASVFFLLATTFYSIAFKLFQWGITDLFTRAGAGALVQLYVVSIIAGTVTTAACVVCVYLAIQLPKTKIWKETYFFTVFVPLFSIMSHIILNVVLKIDFPTTLIVTFWIIAGTPLSCVFAGYSDRTFWKRLRTLGLNQGITLLTIIFLVFIPFLEFLPEKIVVTSRGTIGYQFIVFESGNDTTRVQGQIDESVFTAEVPIPSDIAFTAQQAVNVTNQSSKSRDLKVYLEDLSGNLSKIEQLKVFLTTRNGSEICSLGVNDGNVKYEEVYLTLESHRTMAIGVTALAHNTSSLDMTVMSLSMRLSDNELGMNISVNSV